MTSFLTIPSQRRTLAALLLAIAACCALPATVSAQVVVYKMKFTPSRSFNLDFYDSGYFVAPAKGGAGSFIFTIKNTTPRYYNATGSGDFFPVTRANGNAFMSVRADVGTSTSGAYASYLAWGSAWRATTLNGPTFRTRMKLATRLRGSGIASSDEADAAATRDTNIGFATLLDWQLDWDEVETTDANQQGLSVAETITALSTKLQRQGYRAEVESSSGSSGTGSGSITVNSGN